MFNLKKLNVTNTVDFVSIDTFMIDIYIWI